MVISAANLTCVRKSRFLMMYLVERLYELSLIFLISCLACAQSNNFSSPFRRMTRVSLVLRISPLLPSHLYHLKSRGQRRKLVVSVCVILLMHGVFAQYIIFLRTFSVCRQP